MPVSILPTELTGMLSGTLLGNHENGSPEWHALRDEPGTIGGSEVGAAAGLSEWTSPITLWAKKTNRISSEIEPTIRMKLGTFLEAPLLELFANEHPELEVYTTGTWADRVHDWARANPDGLYRTATGEIGLIEVKVSKSYWYNPPEAYRAQMLWYMRILGIKHGKLIGLIGGDYQEFDVDYDEFESDALMAAAQRLRQHVLDNQMPDWDGSGSTYETIRKLNPSVEDGEVDLDDLGMHYLNELDSFAEAERKLNELKSRVVAAMEGKRKGLIYGEHWITMRASRGLPYIYREKR